MEMEIIIAFLVLIPWIASVKAKKDVNRFIELDIYRIDWIRKNIPEKTIIDGRINFCE